MFVNDCSFDVTLEQETSNYYRSLKIECETDCKDGDIRLVNGYNSHNGVVEICIQGMWGGIGYHFSSRNWNRPMAKVACRQLGLPWNCKFYTCIGSILFTTSLIPIISLSQWGPVHDVNGKT